MKTFLPQNQFMNPASSDAECEAVANLLPPSTAAAELSVSDGVFCAPHNSGERDPSVMLDWAPSEPEAGTAASDIDRLANYFRRNSFIPDYEAIWTAMHDPNAPRLRAGDPVWADDVPLFLRAGA